MNKILSLAISIATVLFILSLLAAFLYPEILPALHLNAVEARTIVISLISLILFLTFFQAHLSMFWRILCIVFSFMVLIESILMLGDWEKFFIR